MSAQGQGAHSHGEAGGGQEAPPPPPQLPASSTLYARARPQVALGWSCLTSSGGTSRRPAARLRLRARKAGAQHRGDAVRCQQVPRASPHDLHALPKLRCHGPHLAGPTPPLGLVQEWTNCANGRGGRDAQTPSLPCLRDGRDSIWTDSHSSSSLINMHSNCLLC